MVGSFASFLFFLLAHIFCLSFFGTGEVGCVHVDIYFDLEAVLKTLPRSNEGLVPVNGKLLSILFF